MPQQIGCADNNRPTSYTVQHSQHWIGTAAAAAHVVTDCAFHSDGLVNSAEHIMCSEASGDGQCVRSPQNVAKGAKLHGYCLVINL
jgi:hypothetical protein